MSGTEAIDKISNLNLPAAVYENECNGKSIGIKVDGNRISIVSKTGITEKGTSCMSVKCLVKIIALLALFVPMVLLVVVQMKSLVRSKYLESENCLTNSETVFTACETTPEIVSSTESDSETSTDTITPEPVNISVVESVEGSATFATDTVVVDVPLETVPDAIDEISKTLENENESVLSLETDYDPLEKFDFYKHDYNSDHFHLSHLSSVLNVSSVTISRSWPAGLDPLSYRWSINCNQFKNTEIYSFSDSFIIDLKYRNGDKMDQTSFETTGDVLLSRHCQNPDLEIINVQVDNFKPTTIDGHDVIITRFEPVELPKFVQGHYQVFYSHIIKGKDSERLCERLGGSLADLDDVQKNIIMEDLSTQIDSGQIKPFKINMNELYNAALFNLSPIICHHQYGDTVSNFTNLSFRRFGLMFDKCARNRHYYRIETMLKANPFISHNGNTILHLAVELDDPELFAMIPKNIYYLHFRNNDEKTAVAEIKSEEMGLLLAERVLLELRLYKVDKDCTDFITTLLEDENDLIESFECSIQKLIIYMKSHGDPTFDAILSIIFKDPNFENLNINPLSITTEGLTIFTIARLHNTNLFKFFPIIKRPDRLPALNSGFINTIELLKYIYKCNMLEQLENYDLQKYTTALFYFAAGAKSLGSDEVLDDVDSRLKTINFDIHEEFRNLITTPTLDFNYESLTGILALNPYVNDKGKTILHFAVELNDPKMFEIAPTDLPLLHILDDNLETCFDFYDFEKVELLHSALKLRVEEETNRSPYPLEINSNLYSILNPNPSHTLVSYNDDGLYYEIRFNRSTLLRSAYRSESNCFLNEMRHRFLTYHMSVFYENNTRIKGYEFFRDLIKLFFEEAVPSGKASDFTAPLFSLYESSGLYVPNNLYPPEVYRFAGNIMNCGVYLGLKFNERFIEPVYRTILEIEPVRPEMMNENVLKFQRGLFGLNTKPSARQDIEKLVLGYAEKQYSTYKTSIDAFAAGFNSDTKYKKSSVLQLKSFIHGDELRIKRNIDIVSCAVKEVDIKDTLAGKKRKKAFSPEDEKVATEVKLTGRRALC